jgi:hypothetical protein
LSIYITVSGHTLVLKLGGLLCGAILTVDSGGLQEKREVHHLYKIWFVSHGGQTASLLRKTFVI